MYIIYRGSSWPWSCGSWIYNYLCKQCLCCEIHQGKVYNIMW